MNEKLNYYIRLKTYFTQQTILKVGMLKKSRWRLFSTFPTSNPFPMYYYGITQKDFSFYLNDSPAISLPKTQEELFTLAHANQILLVTDKEDAEALAKRNDLIIKPLKEYPQPRERNFLILSIAHTPKST